MKIYIRCLLLILFTNSAFSVRAQYFTSTIIGGNDTATTFMDGIPATNAAITGSAIAVDAAGNVYFLQDYRIRKISAATGIVSTIAGTGSAGFSGDGGPATSAQFDCSLISGQYGGLYSDPIGNIYLADYNNNRIRKINAATHIITTVAGGGTGGLGDGGPATNATVGAPHAVTFDAPGNMYIAGGDYRVRKVNTSGIINTVAGTGIGVIGFSGDGGPALSADLGSDVFDLKVDGSGILYINDWSNHRIRKVEAATGIITTVAGNGTMGGSCPDFTPATSCSFSYFSYGIAVDPTGNLLIADGGYGQIHSVDSGTGILHSLDFTVTSSTPPSEFYLCTDTAGNIYFTVYLGKIFKLNPHPSISAFFYVDMNTNCSYDAGDNYIFLPVTAEIDSNGVPVDTITTTSGFSYVPLGSSGDIYAIKILTSPTALSPSCPATGIVYDTLSSTAYTYPTKYMGFNCSSASGYDLGIVAAFCPGPAFAAGTMLVYNMNCTPQPDTVIANVSPKYQYLGAYPAPYSFAGGNMRWAFSGISYATSPPTVISFSMMSDPDTLVYTPGDTVHSNYTVYPIAGDISPANNTVALVDTVLSSYDPNFMAVAPAGYISAGTRLQYTIRFENTGNDTARNIFILDTLSDYVDINTFKMVASSAAMMLTVYTVNGHNAVKFSFQNINLPDSSHHNLCDGMAVFTVKTKSALASGTTILNSAGIYFDQNPVVATNTVQDIIGFPACAPFVKTIQKTQIFPNPATDHIYITAPESTIAHLTNMLGENVLRTIGTSIDIATLPPGVYLITLTNKEGEILLRDRVMKW